jgi:hypothetical protein
MSTFAVVQETSLELRNQIFAALETTPDTDFGLNGDIDKIQVRPPGDELPNGTLATLFLFHIDLERHLRNQRPLPDRTDPALTRRSPLPLQLRYLFVPVDDDDTVNHLVLGRVLQHFYDHPMVTSLRGVPMDDSHGGASDVLRVKPDMLSVEQLSQIWNALSTPYRLSVAFLVEVAAVDSGEPPTRTPRVDELVTAIGLLERT